MKILFVFLHYPIHYPFAYYNNFIQYGWQRYLKCSYKERYIKHNYGIEKSCNTDWNSFAVIEFNLTEGLYIDYSKEGHHQEILKKIKPSNNLLLIRDYLLGNDQFNYLHAVVNNSNHSKVV